MKVHDVAWRCIAKIPMQGTNWTPKDLEQEGPRATWSSRFVMCAEEVRYNMEFLHRFFVDLDFMSLRPLDALLKSSPSRLHDSKLLASMHVRSPTPCDSDILAMTIHICFVQSPLLQSNPKLRSRCQASIEIRCTCTLGLKSELLWKKKFKDLRVWVSHTFDTFQM